MRRLTARAGAQLHCIATRSDTSPPLSPPAHRRTATDPARAFGARQRVVPGVLTPRGWCVSLLHRYAPGSLDGSAARRDWRALAGIAGPACEPSEAWLDGPRATRARTVRAGAPLRCAHVAQTKPRPSLPDCACPAISDFVSPLGGVARVGRFPGSSSMLWRLPLGTTITMQDRAPYS